MLSIFRQDELFGMLLANGGEVIRSSVQHIFSAVFRRERNPPQRNSELRTVKAVNDLPNASLTDVRPRVPIPSVVVPSGIQSSPVESELFELRYGPDNLRGCEFELVTPSAPVRLVIRRYSRLRGRRTSSRLASRARQVLSQAALLLLPWRGSRRRAGECRRPRRQLPFH
jgi:hypothetical protein